MTITFAYPYTFVNGTTGDATQVDANFAAVITAGFSQAAANGANGDITSLSGLTTPLSVAQGGTGRNDGFNLLPPGVIMAYTAPLAPSGWILCTGAAVSRTTFAALFAVIGTTYGAGDGSTTFNLPDLRGRTIAGYDPSNATGRLTGSATGGASAATIGNNGGEQAHTLTTAELAAHAHSITDVQHTHSITDVSHSHIVGTGGTTIGGSPTNVPLTSNTGVFSGYGPAEGALDALTGISATNAAFTGLSATNAQGFSNGHNNVQPTLICNWIIKT